MAVPDTEVVANLMNEVTNKYTCVCTHTHTHTHTHTSRAWEHDPVNGLVAQVLGPEFRSLAST